MSSAQELEFKLNIAERNILLWSMQMAPYTYSAHATAATKQTTEVLNKHRLLGKRTLEFSDAITHETRRTAIATPDRFPYWKPSVSFVGDGGSPKRRCESPPARLPQERMIRSRPTPGPTELIINLPDGGILLTGFMMDTNNYNRIVDTINAFTA